MWLLNKCSVAKEYKATSNSKRELVSTIQTPNSNHWNQISEKNQVVWPTSLAINGTGASTGVSGYRSESRNTWRVIILFRMVRMRYRLTELFWLERRTYSNDFDVEFVASLLHYSSYYCYYRIIIIIIIIIIINEKIKVA